MVDAAVVWSYVAFATALSVGVFLYFAYRRIRSLEIEVRRIVAELSKLE
jgi:hypothetical protein